MAELCKQAKDLIKQFKSFQIQHIDRVNSLLNPGYLVCLIGSENERRTNG